MNLQLLEVAASGVFSAILGFIGFMIKKLLDNQERLMESIRADVEHCHERNDVQDQIIARIIDRPFNSSQIIKGNQDLPT